VNSALEERIDPSRDATGEESQKNPESTDIFISYSRKDAALTGELVDALRNGGLSVWIDTEGIPISAKWLKVIEGAIDRSDSFLFVITTQSLSSDVCIAEFNHASSAGKRILPLVVEGTDFDLLPDALNEIQAFTIRPSVSLLPQLESLINEAKSDPAHVKKHTRLLVRAREWDDHERDSAYLLRGSDLTAAQQWLDRSREKVPTPVAIQQELLASSAEHASKRKLVARVAGVAGLALAIMTAVIASNWLEERRLAAARQLAVAGLSMSDESLDEAAILSVVAHNRADIAETRSALLSVLTKQPRLVAQLYGHVGAITNLRFSRDGELLASASEDKTARIWELTSMPIDGLSLRGHGKHVWSIAFSPSGDQAATGSVDGSIRRWDVDSGHPIGEPMLGHEGYGYVTSVDYSSDGKTIASGSVDGTVRLWDASTGAPKGSPFVGHEQNIWQVTFGPDDGTIVSCSDDGTARLWDTTTAEILDQLRHGKQNQCAMAVGRRTGLVAVGTGENFILWRPFSGQTMTSSLAVERPLQSITAVAVSPGENAIAIGIGDSILMWDVEANALKTSITGIDEGIKSLAFSPDGRLIASGGWSQPVIKLWRVDDRPSFVRGIDGHAKGTMTASFVPHSQRLLTGGWDSKVMLWEVPDLTPTLLGTHGDVGVLSSAISPDGNVAITGDAVGSLVMWNLGSGTQIRSVQAAHEKNVSSIAISPDGRLAASASDDHEIKLWTVVDGKPYGDALEYHSDRVAVVCFDPSSRYLLSGSWDGTIAVWDLRKQKLRYDRIDAHAGGVRGIAVSPNGKTLASAGNDGLVKVWTMETGNMLVPPLLDASGLAVAVAFSPDGRLLAGASTSELTLWDVGTMQSLSSPIPVPSATVSSVSFSPDSRKLAVTSWLNDSNIQIWDVDPISWRERLCRIANRTLSTGERRRFEITDAELACEFGR